MPEFNVSDFAAWSGGVWSSSPARPVTGVSIDTRVLTPGNLFVAIRGANCDGHDFVTRACAAGASGAVVRADWRGAPDAALLRVADPAEALRRIASGYRNSLSGEILAVTGSVGKTTVKEMLADLLATCAPTARTRGNFNNDLGLPLSLLAMERTHAFGVFEIGMNHPGELAPLCALLQPRWGVITTVGAVHLEFFPSVRAIAEEKAALFRALPPDGTAVVSRDQEWFEVFRASALCRLVTTSLRGTADYTARVVSDCPARFVARETVSGAEADIELPVPGRHAIENALLAVAVARGHGLAWTEIAAALARYRPAAMRWNCIQTDGVTWINDAYNANPISMRAALRTFAELPMLGRKWLALGGMRELGAASHDEHFALGGVVARGAWAGLAAVGPLGADIAAGAAAAGMPPDLIHRCDDCAAAAALLRKRIRPGDAILLKASRGEQLEDILRCLGVAMEAH